MDFHLEVLPDETKVLLPILGKLPSIKKFYLAGGTGLALQIGHRISADLDFFSREDFDNSEIIRQLQEAGEFQLEKKSESTIIAILNKVKLSFLKYNYPLIADLKKAESISLADIIDIACMKTDAISNRGTKRDFVDIYFIAREFYSLGAVLNKFAEKYKSINYNLMHIKKSLVYFEDAENDPLPRMLKPIDWEAVKSFFRKEITKLV